MRQEYPVGTEESMIFKTMVFGQMNEQQRKILSIDEEALFMKRKMKNEGSALLILGIFMLIFAVANQLVLMDLLYEDASDVTKLLVNAVIFLIGIACCVFGVRCFGKTGISVAEGVASSNKELYTQQEIADFYREVREDREAIVFLSGKTKIKEEDAAKTGILTKNWMKIPGQTLTILAKISDIAAAWHDESGQQYGFVGLYILRSDGELFVMDSHPEFSAKVMEEIGKRNPLTILAGRFTYEGKTYNSCANKEQVVEIYKQNLERQLNAGREGR